MPVCLLLRHGRTTSNAAGTLAGWLPGVDLDETGVDQARRVGRRLALSGVVDVVTSPLTRCRSTAAHLLDELPADARPEPTVDDRLGEARYGAWTGRSLKDLAQEPVWRDVQERPSTVSFPPHPEHEHESMTAMQARAVAAIAEWDARVEDEHGPAAVWVAVSHGDVIKAILADALGMHLDDFQRIVVDPASLSIVHRALGRSFVLRTNDTGSDPVDLSGWTRQVTDAPPDAAVGGGAGTGAAGAGSGC